MKIIILLTFLMIYSTASTICSQDKISKLIIAGVSVDEINLICVEKTDKPKLNGILNKNDRSTKSYFGLGTSIGEGKFTSDSISPVNQSYDSASVPIKFGIMFDSNDRIELSYEYVAHNYDDRIDQIIGINFDWNSVYKFGQISPYWSIGFGQYKCDYSKDESLKGYISALAFNYGVGILINLDNLLEIEISAKRKNINWQEKVYENGNTASNSSSISSLYYFGVNYFF